jgi:nicotinamidase/pyrazinamidase
MARRLVRVGPSASTSTLAILVIDMVNDFVTGVFGNARAQAMAPRLAGLLDRARWSGVPVIYCNDSHLAGVDAELRVHPDHALRGSWGAQIAPELTNAPSDYVVSKRRYSAFFGTELHSLLLELGVTTLVLTGVATNGCVQHTAADAFFHGYHLLVVSDCVETSDDAAQQHGLQTMAQLYGARLATSVQLDLGDLVNR